MENSFGAPNFLKIIDGYEAGQRMRERSKLQELTEKGRQLSGEVLAGNRNKLAELYSVNPEMGMQVANFTEQQKRQFVTDFTREAYGATTPEQWSTMINRYKAKGHVFDPGEDAFENRDALIARGLDVGDMMGLDLRKQDAERSQANADRSYGLQVRGFQADQNWRATQADLEQQKLRAAGPELVEMYDEKSGQPYKAQWNSQTQTFDRVGGIKAPSGGTQLELGPDGTLSFSQGMGKITEGQGKDISYLNRMLTAAPILDRNDEALTSFGENVAGNAPLVGNYMKSSQFQQAEQAGRNFLTALLRKESGAQIPPAEERSYGDIFLPRPGDKREVIAQKREARRQAAIGIKMGLPAHIIKGMVQQGVDFTTLDPDTTAAPQGSGVGRKSDMRPSAGDAPRGVDPGTWQFMTSEERALWK